MSTHIIAPKRTPYISDNVFGSFRTFFMYIFGLYALLSPVYIFHSGLPQPADMLISIAVFPALAILFLKHKGPISTPILVGTSFVMITIAINLVNFSIFNSLFPSQRFLLSSLYYLYNFIVFIFTAAMFKHYPKQMKKITYVALATIIIIQIPHIYLFPDDTRRMTGTLNNPNQLAYWSLLSFFMILLIRSGEKLKLFDFILFGCLIYLQTLALSKAGLITFTLALFIMPFMPHFTHVGRTVLIIVISITAIFGVFQLEKTLQGLEQLEAVDRVVSRIENIGQENDDSPEARRYDRLWKYPYYTLLGAGEGAYERFNPEKPNEMHSGLGTIFFAYGLTGGFLFLYFIWCVIRKQPWYYLALFGCVFLYSLPHQNIRFTHFWVLLGMLEASPYLLARTRTAFNIEAPQQHQPASISKEIS